MPNPNPVFVPNAGLVLAGPYLPRLWERLALTNDRKFGDAAAAHRAAYLMDYLVFGDTQPPESLSTLTRLLCGMPLEARAVGPIDTSADEKKMIDELLMAMISHWSSLGQTSIAGLREAFLQRDGQLEHRGHTWNLNVSARSFDVLLDRIPWVYSPCKHPWMSEALHVQWR